MPGALKGPACPAIFKFKKPSPYHDKDASPSNAPQYGYPELLEKNRAIVQVLSKKKQTDIFTKKLSSPGIWTWTGDRDHVYKHLGGAFWQKQAKNGSPLRNCQLLIVKKKPNMKCEASKIGTEIAESNLDLINYNLYMLSQQLPSSPSKPKPPSYIYYAGKQTANHCTLFALNNALQFPLFDAKSYKLPGKGDENYPFPMECFTAAVAKVGLRNNPVAQFKKDKPMDKYGVKPDAYKNKLRKVGAVQDYADGRQVVAKVFNVVNSGNAAHMYTFKLMEDGWYGFDANIATVLGPVADFETVFAGVLAASHKYFTKDGTRPDRFKWENGILYDLKPRIKKASRAGARAGSENGYSDTYMFEPDYYEYYENDQWNHHNTLETPRNFEFSAVLVTLLLAAVCMCFCAAICWIGGFIGGTVIGKFLYLVDGDRKNKREDANGRQMYRQV